MHAKSVKFVYSSRSMRASQSLYTVEKQPKSTLDMYNPPARKASVDSKYISTRTFIVAVWTVYEFCEDTIESQTTLINAFYYVRTYPDTKRISLQHRIPLQRYNFFLTYTKKSARFIKILHYTITSLRLACSLPRPKRNNLCFIHSLFPSASYSLYKFLTNIFTQVTP